MAANEVLQKSGTPIVLADVTDYSSTASGLTRTGQIDLTSLASNAARQSDKFDFGATRAARYAVKACFELDVAPTAGTVIEVYLSASHSGTAGTGNDGGASGADGAYKAGEEDEWARTLTHLGNYVCTADAAPVATIQTLGALSPLARYGSVVVVDKAGQAFEGDAVEMFIAFIPIVDEIQAAA